MAEMSAGSGNNSKRFQSPRSTSRGHVSVMSDHSIEPPLTFGDKRFQSPRPRSSGRVSVMSDHSIEPPLTFGDKRFQSPRPTSSGRVSVMSDHSIEPPLTFGDKRFQSPRPTSSGRVSVMSDHSIEPPLTFGDKRRTPKAGRVFGNTTDVSDVSKDTLHNLKDTHKTPYGMPQAWGGHVISSRNPSRFYPQCPPAAVYTMQRDDNKEKTHKDSNRNGKPDDDYSHYETESSSGSRLHSGTNIRYYPVRSESTPSDDPYEDTIPSDDTGDERICDICHRAKAVKICQTCKCSYCETHVQQHYTVKALEWHKLVDTLRYDPELPDKMVPPPGRITFLSVKTNSVLLSWGCPQGLQGPKTFRVKWSSSDMVEDFMVVRDVLRMEITNLEIGQMYEFSVATQDDDGILSEWVTASVFTAIPVPRLLTVEHSQTTSLLLKWTKGEKIEQIPHKFLITVETLGNEPLAIHTEDSYKMFTDLKPDTEYIISVSTVLNSRLSERVSMPIHTEPCLGELLSKLGLTEQYDNKLTISTVLEINQNDISGHKPETLNSPPEAFVKRLITLDTNTRSVQCLSHNVDTDKKNAINPLDLTTAVFLCSDGFLQQDMVLKMSLCQFAVPLLLPNQEQRKITMMLWSMREIVQTFSPSIQAFSKMSCEERMVLSDIHLVSFVRLGRTAFSKSELLNHLFSNTQHYHDTFYHRNMECGDVPRTISEGLVEITWYLPCGNRKIDKFTEPMAVANLRGDIKAFDLQFSFLCETSAAVYVFCDESESDYFKNLEGKDLKADVILISSVQGKNFTLKTVKVKPNFKTTNESQRRKKTMEVLEPLHKSISKILESSPNKVSIANMAKTARDFGILVDEDSDECQSARKNVSKVTRCVADTSEFKDTQLPSQGQVWKAISWIENEYWRLRNTKNNNKEDYRKSLKSEEKKLRQKQQRNEKSPAMSHFLHGLVTSEVQRYYFLKWLEIDLENASWDHVSALQNRYKEICQKFPQDKEKIADIEKQISDASLCLRHFFRECGQLYECSSSLPEYSRQRKTMENLPALHAQMLLDGFPVELVDGDASNIPIKWITNVLTELHDLMHSNSKVKVIAVIGSENSGKSTLLNSMFGVRFAVSRGRGTRGAFIQLLNVHKDIRMELGCDCIMLIDTEGLKPHQMVQNDHSHERDKEVASLAVALSDITIVSLAKGNSSEEDVLEMVLQAFIRLKDKGEKQLCHVVCPNTADVPAAERDKSHTVLVQQLNQIIQKDVNMKKANITKISDVMKFDPETCCWNIPPLWRGTPPMAPVSSDYSKIVHTLKTRLLGDLRKSKDRGDLPHFVKRLEEVWKAL